MSLQIPLPPAPTCQTPPARLVASALDHSCVRRQLAPEAPSGCLRGVLPVHIAARADLVEVLVVLRDGRVEREGVAGAEAGGRGEAEVPGGLGDPEAPPALYHCPAPHGVTSTAGN